MRVPPSKSYFSGCFRGELRLLRAIKANTGVPAKAKIQKELRKNGAKMARDAASPRATNAMASG